MTGRPQRWRRWPQWRPNLPWLGPRQPDRPPLTLSQRRIYVLPTTAGMLYAATVLLMLVGSINYNLSLGYALTFLLGGLGIVAIVQSFRNLAGLQLAPGRHTPGCAGGKVQFGVRLHSLRARPGLRLQLAGGTPLLCHMHEQAQVELDQPALQRGWLAMPRLTVSSTWPLGLVRAWSYVRFAEACLVYPAPGPALPLPAADGGEGRQPRPDEPDDFFGLRPHRSSDLLQHVAWKASARLEDQLLSKQFAAEQGAALWLDLMRTPGTTLEDKLSQLTRWVLDAHATQRRYSLRLGSTVIAAPGGGPGGTAHLHACLEALALYP